VSAPTEGPPTPGPAARAEGTESAQPPGPAIPERPPPPRARSIVDALNFAFDGIIHVLRTQRNMRVHFAIAAGVLVLALVVGVSRAELIALMLSVSFVLVTEMINTALEGVVDLATSRYDPLARMAKDVSAGAVLIAAVNALAVGYLVFADRLAHPSTRLLTRVRQSPLHLTLITLILLILAVIAVKAVSGRGTPMRGGLPSGHAAIAFASWAAITFITADYAHHVLISTLAFIMALLVSQSRVEAGIHSVLEVVYGALLGVMLTLVVFQLWL
jgi:diacylglycerol kinase (ATP)